MLLIVCQSVYFIFCFPKIIVIAIATFFWITTKVYSNEISAIFLSLINRKEISLQKRKEKNTALFLKKQALALRTS
jgi:hypothetical protein